MAASSDRSARVFAVGRSLQTIWPARERTNGEEVSRHRLGTCLLACLASPLLDLRTSGRQYQARYCLAGSTCGSGLGGKRANGPVGRPTNWHDKRRRLRFFLARYCYSSAINCRRPFSAIYLDAILYASQSVGCNGTPTSLPAGRLLAPPIASFTLDATTTTTTKPLQLLLTSKVMNLW